jgi:hypothetical protein
MGLQRNPHALGEEIPYATGTVIYHRISFDEFQEVADGAVRFDGMAQGLIDEHLIMIFSSDFFSANKTPVLQVLHNPLDPALRDTYQYGNFAENQIRIGIKRNQDMRMIG